MNQEGPDRDFAAPRLWLCLETQVACSLVSLSDLAMKSKKQTNPHKHLLTKAHVA